MTFNFKKNWRTTTALCFVSTIAVASAAYAANGGRSNWDERPHHHRFANQDNNKNGNNSDNNNKKDKDPGDKVKTATPIKHVIILIGENRGLDHTFGVYKPKGKKQTISNLLSKGIVNDDGSPGPHFADAQQFQVSAQPSYYIGAPPSAKTPYDTGNLMPQPNTNGAPSAQSATGAPFQTVAQALIEPDIEADDVSLLTTGATGLPSDVLDTRIPG